MTSSEQKPVVGRPKGAKTRQPKAPAESPLVARNDYEKVWGRKEATGLARDDLASPAALARLGQCFRERRIALDLSQRGAAVVTGIYKDQISALERGWGASKNVRLLAWDWINDTEPEGREDLDPPKRRHNRGGTLYVQPNVRKTEDGRGRHEIHDYRTFQRDNYEEWVSRHSRQTLDGIEGILPGSEPT